MDPCENDLEHHQQIASPCWLSCSSCEVSKCQVSSLTHDHWFGACSDVHRVFTHVHHSSSKKSRLVGRGKHFEGTSLSLSSPCGQHSPTEESFTTSIPGFRDPAFKSASVHPARPPRSEEMSSRLPQSRDLPQIPTRSDVRRETVEHL